MSEPVNVVLAMARVYNEVQLESEAPDEIDLSAGAELQMRFAYRAYEQSADEDHWMFRLVAQVDGEEQAVTERTHIDRKLIADDILSHVGVDIHFPAKGEFTLTWECFSKLSRREWGDKKPPATVSEGNIGGSLIVRVHA